MRIAVLENLQSNAPVSQDDAADEWAELGTPVLVGGIVDALNRGGHVARFFEGDLNLLKALPGFRPDLCFNICEMWKSSASARAFRC